MLTFQNIAYHIIIIIILVKHIILSNLQVFNLIYVCDFGAEMFKIEPFFYFALNDANA